VLTKQKTPQDDTKSVPGSAHDSSARAISAHRFFFDL
jgi:hypothetical protein